MHTGEAINTPPSPDGCCGSSFARGWGSSSSTHAFLNYIFFATNFTFLRRSDVTARRGVGPVYFFFADLLSTHHHTSHHITLLAFITLTHRIIHTYNNDGSF